MKKTFVLNDAEFNLVDFAIICKNEAHNVDAFLDNIYDCADGIIVIDSGSADTTTSLIKEYHYKKDTEEKIKLFSSAMVGFGDQKNLAISKTNSLFTFVLDLDERLSEDLRRDLRDILTENADKDMLVLDRFNYVGDEKEELFQEKQYRLFKSFVRYVGSVHEEAVGWQKELSLELPEKYHIIHEKTKDRFEENQHFYTYLLNMYPCKSMAFSRAFNKEVLTNGK